MTHSHDSDLKGAFPKTVKRGEEPVVYWDKDIRFVGLLRLQSEIKNLRQAENKLMLFSAFADAQAKFELVEQCVHELDMVFEAAAQLELDIERGK